MASNVPEDLSKSNESQNSGENSSSDSSQSSLVSKLPGVNFLKEKVKKTTSKIKSYSDRIYWDPLASNDWDVAGPPNHFVSTRIKRFDKSATVYFLIFFYNFFYIFFICFIYILGT